MLRMPSTYSLPYVLQGDSGAVRPVWSNASPAHTENPLPVDFELAEDVSQVPANVLPCA